MQRVFKMNTVTSNPKKKAVVSHISDPEGRTVKFRSRSNFKRGEDLQIKMDQFMAPSRNPCGYPESSGRGNCNGEVTTSARRFVHFGGEPPILVICPTYLDTTNKQMRVVDYGPELRVGKTRKREPTKREFNISLKNWAALGDVNLTPIQAVKSPTRHRPSGLYSGGLATSTPIPQSRAAIKYKGSSVKTRDVENQDPDSPELDASPSPNKQSRLDTAHGNNKLYSPPPDKVARMSASYVSAMKQRQVYFRDDAQANSYSRSLPRKTMEMSTQWSEQRPLKDRKSGACELEEASGDEGDKDLEELEKGEDDDDDDDAESDDQEVASDLAEAGSDAEDVGDSEEPAVTSDHDQLESPPSSQEALVEDDLAVGGIVSELSSHTAQHIGHQSMQEKLHLLKKAQKQLASSGHHDPQRAGPLEGTRLEEKAQEDGQPEEVSVEAEAGDGSECDGNEQEGSLIDGGQDADGDKQADEASGSPEPATGQQEQNLNSSPPYLSQGVQSNQDVFSSPAQLKTYSRKNTPNKSQLTPHRKNTPNKSQLTPHRKNTPNKSQQAGRTSLTLSQTAKSSRTQEALGQTSKRQANITAFVSKQTPSHLALPGTTPVSIPTGSRDVARSLRLESTPVSRSGRIPGRQKFREISPVTEPEPGVSGQQMSLVVDTRKGRMETEPEPGVSGQQLSQVVDTRKGRMESDSAREPGPVFRDEDSTLAVVTPRAVPAPRQKKGRERTSSHRSTVKLAPMEGVRIYRGEGGQKRNSTSLCDLDIILNVVENIGADYRDEADSDVCKKAICSFTRRLQRELQNMLETTEQVKSVKSTVWKTKMLLKNRRRDLFDLQQEEHELLMSIAAAQQEEASEQENPGQDSAYLVQFLEDMAKI